ncbi:hypothetical protein TcasGA2_TC034590 [Tribolium castaneum]|uniref:Uncharacterized protein n=1 Tax=Tribolium castaneum TaxID=7070 RepID=A0A139WLI7_TRICA|nr:hypothetical protein TcasGA2_TC034590 [Tribolium castaneum]
MDRLLAAMHEVACDSPPNDRGRNVQFGVSCGGKLEHPIEFSNFDIVIRPTVELHLISADNDSLKSIRGRIFIQSSHAFPSLKIPVEICIRTVPREHGRDIHNRRIFVLNEQEIKLQIQCS